MRRNPERSERGVVASGEISVTIPRMFVDLYSCHSPRRLEYRADFRKIEPCNGCRIDLRPLCTVGAPHLFEVDVCHCLRDRENGIAAIVAGSNQSSLLPEDGHENNAPLRSFLKR